MWFALLHLIGCASRRDQFGSPVDPKTPEADGAAYIDNLDARLEMFAAGYLTPKPLAERISNGSGRCRASWSSRPDISTTTSESKIGRRII